MRQVLKRKIRAHIPALIMLLVLVTVFTMGSPYFLSLSNFMNILMQMTPLYILAIGLTLVVVGGNLDLSGGAVVALVSVVCGLLMKMGAPVPLALLAGLLSGAAVGLLSGFCVAFLGMPSFILTLAMQIMVRGAALAIAGGATIYGLPDSFMSLGMKGFMGIPIPVFIMLILLVLAYFFLQHSVMGYHIHAVGQDRKGAMMAGINSSYVTLLTFVLAGLLYAVAAILMTSQIGAAVSTGGDGMEMTALACLAIGGVSLAGGKGDELGTLLGCLIIGVLSNGVNMMNLSPYYTNIIRGGVIFGALLIESIRVVAGRRMIRV